MWIDIIFFLNLSAFCDIYAYTKTFGSPNRGGLCV